MSLFVTVLALSFVLFTDSTSAADTKILIDPGHGGKDPGAQGNGLKEKDVTLDISKRVNSVLNSNYDVSTKMTRNSNKTVSLNNRTSVANSWGADLFLSVHINAGGGTGYEDYIHSSFGPQTYSMKRYDTTSPKVQAAIRAEVNKVLDKYGIRDRGAKRANFHVLRESGMPAVLLEIMFIDTKKDADLLKNNNFKQDMAVSISKGVANAYKLKAKNKPDTNIAITNVSQDYIVTTNRLNIRSGNGTNFGVIGKVKKNFTFKGIGKTSNGWYKFKYKGKDAYVSGKHVKGKPNANNIWTTKDNKEYLVTTTNLNIRSGNSTQYGVVGTISKNKTIKAIGKTSNNWIKFKHKGKDAFVSGSLLKDKPKASKPTPKPDKPSNGKTYTVKSGDTLYSVAVKNNVSVNNLKKWNNLSSNIISVNQKLKLSKKATSSKPSKPNSSKTYKVKSGDTLYSIGVKNNVSVKNLKSWNNLNSNIISVNQKLRVSKNATSSKPSVGSTKKMTVTASLLNVRDKATMNGSKVIDTLSKGTKVDVKKKYNKYWYQIDHNGKNGYVSTKHIK